MAQSTDPGDSAVYVGFWIDHDNGPFLTLTNQNATALITFLAVAVTFAGNRSWKIVRFALYHFLYSSNSRSRPATNMTRQLQVLLRNVVTAGSTLYALIEIAWDNRLKARTSRKSHCGQVYDQRARSTTWRKWMLLGVAAAHFIAFITAGILTSRIVIGRVVVSRTVASCGQW